MNLGRLLKNASGVVDNAFATQSSLGAAGAPALPGGGDVCSTLGARIGAATGDFQFIAAIVVESTLFLRR